MAARLAALLSGGTGGLADPTGSDLVFEASLVVHSLAPSRAPDEVWAVDGGQSLVADARVVQVYATRAATVRWSAAFEASTEMVGPLAVWLLGLGADDLARSAMGPVVVPGCSVDVNLLRDWAEWTAASECVAAAQPGAVVLVDGDLSPDWRLAPGWVSDLLERAADREVTVAGVTKHTSLAWGGAPLVGAVEALATSTLGERACWWVPIGRHSASGAQVVVARLDPDARFAFRVDLAPGVDPAATLGALCRVSDDAAFPGYPWPLTVADRLAACPSWVRTDVWAQIERLLEKAGVAAEVRERAFTDRHRLMERS